MGTDSGLRREQKGVALAMGIALVASLAALGLAVAADRGAPALPFALRLQATLFAELFVVPWLAAAIGNVARLRFVSERDIAGSGAEGGTAEVRMAGAILQNTLEQVVLALAAHLIATAAFDPSATLVTTLAGLFALGRLLFWAGYRHGARGRALGFALTFYPSVLALAGSAFVGLLG